MNLISDDRRDFLARATHTLDRAKLKSTLVAATAGAGQGITVHVLRGADPAHLVFIARSLLEQAAEWMEADADHVTIPTADLTELIAAAEECASDVKEAIGDE